MTPLPGRSEIVSALRTALEPFPEVVFAYLFGSAAVGELRNDSDIDLAVFLDSDGRLEVEESTRWTGLSGESIRCEADLQLAAERATDRNVDLLILNRAPATVCATAVTRGVELLCRDGSLRTRYFLAATKSASDFEVTEREFREIRARSRSLAEEDRVRLDRILAYIEEELVDRDRFLLVSLPRYRSDRDVRRSIDRWVEMLINAAIDSAKIVLSSERREVPRTYGQILDDLGTLPAFSDLGEALRPLAGLRNLMAHEYLDLRFGRVSRFVREDVELIERLAALTRRWLENL